MIIHATIADDDTPEGWVEAHPAPAHITTHEQATEFIRIQLHEANQILEAEESPLRLIKLVIEP